MLLDIDVGNPVLGIGNFVSADGNMILSSAMWRLPIWSMLKIVFQTLP
jgi:hypothetical protein